VAEWFSSASNILINKNDFAKVFENNEQNDNVVNKMTIAQGA